MVSETTINLRYTVYFATNHLLMQLGCHVSVGPLRSSENIRSFIVSSLVYCIDHKALAKRL